MLKASPSRRSVLRALALSGAHAATTRSHGFPVAQRSTAEIDSDPLRPRFHYLPARNWMNDPCAPVFFGGAYHMFHQYNPHASVWGDMHWAHASSPDMLHWKRLPVSLAPTPGGADSAGVFTGSALPSQGSVQPIIYTGVERVTPAQATINDGRNFFRETQLLASSSDPGLATWTKRAEPVIAAPPPGLAITGFRDPAPFRLGDRLYLAVGSGLRNRSGMILLYRAAKNADGRDDVTQWEYLHPLAESPVGRQADTADPVDNGTMWKCPDVFALHDTPSGALKHVLIYSTMRRTLWQVGRLDSETLRFHPESTGELDHGPRTFYAPKTQLDARGNRILWGWLPETRPEAEYAAAGWSGLLSLPRVLTVESGSLRMHPLPAISSLRRQEVPIVKGAAAAPAEINEFFATLAPGGAQAAPPGPFVLHDAKGLLLAIRSESTYTPPEDPAVLRPPTWAPISGELRVFFDHSALELFLDGRLCYTLRFYQRRPSTPVLTLVLPAAVEVRTPRAWTLRTT